MRRYFGVDLHRNCFTVCELKENGENEITQPSIKSLGDFAKKLRSTDELAVEATGNTKYFCDELKNSGCKIVVVNPSQFQVISRSVSKTDENDAQTLAKFLSKGMLPEVRMKDKLQAQIASLVQTRDKLVKLRTILKNKINNLLAGEGILIKKESLSSEKSMVTLLDNDLEDITRIELEVMISQIASLNKSVEKLDLAIKDKGKDLSGHKNLKSIKGIGDFGASVLASVIGDIKHFRDEGELASYMGIVPRVCNSNETMRSGRITKRGSKIGRTTLVQCSLIAMRYSPYLASFYKRVKTTRGTGKAIIALARKFLGIIFKTLKNNWIFESFPDFVLAKQ